EAAEELRQAAEMQVGGGVEERLREREDLAPQAVPHEPETDERIVVRPDRPVVIGRRMEAPLSRPDLADAPAGEELGIEETAGDARRALRRRDAREEHLSGVRGTDAARVLVAVERERIGPELVAPERFLEARAHQ